MSKWGWITPTWPKLCIGIGIIAVLMLVLKVTKVLTTSESIDLLLLASLVLVTAVYAVETARIAKSSEKSRFGSSHPALSIVYELNAANYREDDWLGRPEPVHTSFISLRNFGIGPALNGVIALFMDSELLGNSTLPSLGSGWGTTTEVVLSDRDKRVTRVEILYEDVFGYIHRTSYNVVMHSPNAMNLTEESHECLYEDSEQSIQDVLQTMYESSASGDSSEGEQNMMNDETRLTTHYNNAISIYYHEADLLFKRSNFFITGMSFLIAAFTVALTAWDIPCLLGYTVAVLGYFLSLFFTFVNFSAANNLVKLREYIFKAEDELKLTTTKVKEGPFNSAFNHLRQSEAKSCRERFDSHYPAPHTWIVPSIFALVWFTMLIHLMYSKCESYVWLPLIFTVLLTVSFLIWAACKFCRLIQQIKGA